MREINDKIKRRGREMKKTIKLRPHHLLCISHYYRGGYSKEYSKNIRKICNRIRNNPRTMIEIVSSCDNICNKCPYQNQGICEKIEGLDEIIAVQDSFVLKKLGLNYKSIYKARKLFNLVRNEIKNGDLYSLCIIQNGCEYIHECIKWGFNQSFFKDLNSKK